MSEHDRPTPAPQVAPRERAYPNRSLTGPGADQELERAMLARQTALGPSAAPPEEPTGTWFPSWFTEMMSWSGASSSGPSAPGGPASHLSGGASLGPDGASAQGTAITRYDDGRASAVVGAGHWSQEDGFSGDMAATRSQSVLFADNDTAWERTDRSTSANASYGPDAWSAEVARYNGRTSHYEGHEVSTTSRSALTGNQDGIGVSNRSTRSIDDDGVVASSQRDASLGYSWEHGLNLGYGYGTVLSDGDDFRMTRDYGVSYAQGVAQGSVGNTSHVVDADGRVMDSASNYTAGWDMTNGFLGSATQSSSIVSGDDYDRRQSSIAYNGQDGLAAGMTTASRRTDDDGIVWSDDRSATASWNAEGQSVGLSRVTSRNDDGIIRSTDSRGTFGFSEDTGLSAVASTERVLSDGEDFRMSRGADFALSAEGGHVGLNDATHVVDADGVTHDASRSGQLGWDPQGLFAEYRQSQNTSQGEDFNRRESTLGFRAGAFSAGNTFASRDTAEDGTVCTVDTAMSGTWGPDGASVSGSRSNGTSWDGITGGSSTSGTLGRDADGNLTFSGATNTGIADGEVYHDRRGATASYQGGIFRAEGTSDVRYTDLNDVRHDRQRAVGLTAGNGAYGVSASQTRGSLDDGISVNNRTTGNVAVGPDGTWSVGGQVERSVGMDDDYNTGRSLGGSIRQDGFDATAGNTARWTDVDGNQHQSSSGATVGFRNGHANAGMQSSSSVRTADGNTTTRNNQVAMSTDGTLSGSTGSMQRDAEGNAVRGHSVSGSADLLGDQRSVTGAASVTRGKMTYNVGGGVQYEVSPPAQQGNNWVVSYRQGINASAGGTGGEGGSMAPADKAYAVRTGVQGGLTAGGAVTASGVRTFPTEEAATAFYERPDIGLMEGPPASIADALAMRDGDSSTSLMSGSLGANGSVGWGPFLTASAGIQGGVSSGMTVTRGAGETVSVTVDDAETLSGTLGLSTIGLGMTGGVSDTDFESVTWSFDLSKPTAQEAYSAFVGSGQMPVEGDGVVRASVTVGDSQTETTGINLAGMSLSTRSGTTSAVTTGADGTVIEEDTGTSGWGGSASWLGFSASEDHSMKFSEVNDERRFMAGTSVVDHSSATNAYEGLAKANGDKEYWHELAGSSSGKWTYEAVFDEDAMDRFVAAVEAGNYEPHGSGMLGREGWDMQAALREASGDTDAQRAILAQFVEDGGTEAIGQVQQTAGGRQGFLTLEGSDVWVGRAVYMQQRSEIEWLSQQLDDHNVTFDVHKRAISLRADLQYRLGRMQDENQYREVPPTLRASETMRISDLLDQATRIAESIELEFALASGPSGFNSMNPENIVDGDNNLAASKGEAIAKKVEMEALAETAHAERSSHESGYPNPKDTLGDSGFFGWAATGPEYDTYLSIDREWDATSSARTSALESEKSAEWLSTLNAAEASRSVALWTQAGSSFSTAVTGYNKIVSLYTEIRTRHGSKTYLWR